MHNTNTPHPMGESSFPYSPTFRYEPPLLFKKGNTLLEAAQLFPLKRNCSFSVVIAVIAVVIYIFIIIVIIIFIIIVIIIGAALETTTYSLLKQSVCRRGRHSLEWVLLLWRRCPYVQAALHCITALAQIIDG